MKKFIAVSTDNLGRQIGVDTFDTKKECKKWFLQNHDNGNCSYYIQFSEKLKKNSPEDYSDVENEIKYKARFN